MRGQVCDHSKREPAQLASASLRGSFRATLLLVLVWSAAACGGGGDEDGSKGERDGGSGADADVAHEDKTKDYTTFDVEWRDDAVILDDVAQVQSALLSADYESGQFVFMSDFAGLDALQVDAVALIAGVGIFRIVDRETVEDGEQLTLEPAKLTDVIDHGTIEWRRSFVTSAADNKLGLGIDEDEADSIAALPQALGSYKDGKLEYSGKIGDFDTSFSLEQASAGLDMQMSTKYSAGTAVANAVVKGHINALTNESKIRIDASSLEYMSVKFLDVRGDVTIEGGAVEVGIPDVRVQVPARLSLPVVIGGIPFRIDVGGSLEWVSTLKANTSARLTGSATFQGGVGLVYEDGSATPLATFEHSEVKTGEVEQVGTIDAGLSLLMNFPELGVGVGVAKVAEAGAAFKFKTESITNFSLRYEAAGPVPVITGNCLRSHTNFGATLVEQATLLGFEVTKDETPLFAELGKESAKGDACD